VSTREGATKEAQKEEARNKEEESPAAKASRPASEGENFEKERGRRAEVEGTQKKAEQEKETKAEVAAFSAQGQMTGQMEEKKDEVGAREEQRPEAVLCASGEIAHSYSQEQEVKALANLPTGSEAGSMDDTNDETSEGAEAEEEATKEKQKEETRNKKEVDEETERKKEPLVLKLRRFCKSSTFGPGKFINSFRSCHLYRFPNTFLLPPGKDPKLFKRVGLEPVGLENMVMLEISIHSR
jgi:hypothetical protein